MYKLKTKSAAKKRFRKTGGKKVLFKRGKAYRRHLMTKKSAKTLRQLRSTAYISGVDAHHIAALLPY